MAGLVPAIAIHTSAAKDGRDTPGHDENLAGRRHYIGLCDQAERLSLAATGVNFVVSGMAGRKLHGGSARRNLAQCSTDAR
jgi:hypothetical protein